MVAGASVTQSLSCRPPGVSTGVGVGMRTRSASAVMFGLSMSKAMDVHVSSAMPWAMHMHCDLNLSVKAAKSRRSGVSGGMNLLAHDSAGRTAATNSTM